jgi:di/tricarboxylate transporter
MTLEAILTLSILGITLIAMAGGVLRLDVLALLMLLSLGVGNILTVQELLSGFSDPVVFTITALFVVGQAIQSSGLAQRVGQGIIHITGPRELPLMVGLVIAVAGLSGLMSSTGTLAVFLPVAIALAQQVKIHPGRLLMPMAFAAFVGGMLTLIGTPPNLVVNTTLKEAGLTAFGFFSFSIPGLLALGILILYFCLFGRKQLPQNPVDTLADTSTTMQSLMKNYQLEGAWQWFRVSTDSPLIKSPLSDLHLPADIQLLCFQSGHKHQHFNWCDRHTQLSAEDNILVQGEPIAIQSFIQVNQLQAIANEPLPHILKHHQHGIAELMILPRSQWVGKTLTEIDFRNRYHLHVTQITRLDQVIQSNLANINLRFADILLVQGHAKSLEAVKRSSQLLLINAPEFTPPLQWKKVVLTLFWIFLMLGLLTFGSLPMAIVILAISVGLVVTRCLTMEEAYRSISWETVILIAAMLPMATALQKVGIMDAGVAYLKVCLAGVNPTLVMASLFALTSGLSLILSNTATTVLMAPVALQLAGGLETSPQAFLMIVALAASSAFSSPMASPVNLMVMSQGGYRFKDYVKVGLPLQLLMLIVIVGAVSWLYP